jgi:uncharacterized protein
MRERTSPQPTTRLVVVFYLIMGLSAWGLGWLFAARDITATLPDRAVSGWVDIALGAGVGLAAVGLSRVLERAFAWARQLSHAMRALLGTMSAPDILAWAVCSAIGEELLFRGLLQPWLGLLPTTLIFGLLHMGPDRRYWPWTVMALVMGLGFGLMFSWTGSLLSPIIAHFTINFFNLHALMTLSPQQPPAPLSPPRGPHEPPP